jgi:hypothetical protein
MGHEAGHNVQPGARNEQDRLAALDNYDVLDTPQEEAFDRVTRLVRSIFGVSMSTVTLIDGHRQWFKSQHGMPNQETERGPALCNAAINHPRPLIVPDTLQDPRFANNPFVVGAPFIRFSMPAFSSAHRRDLRSARSARCTISPGHSTARNSPFSLTSPRP